MEKRLTMIQGIVYNGGMKRYKTIWLNQEKKQKRLHRYLMEQYVHRQLLPSELVHHINDDITDNRIENLKIISRSEHKKAHPEIGMKTRFKKQFFFNEDLLIRLRKQKLSMKKIADKMGCSQPTIFRALKEYGIK